MIAQRPPQAVRGWFVTMRTMIKSSSRSRCQTNLLDRHFRPMSPTSCKPPITGDLKAPAILTRHSPGDAATLIVASRIPDTNAVTAIAVPVRMTRVKLFILEKIFRRLLYPAVFRTSFESAVIRCRTCMLPLTWRQTNSSLNPQAFDGNGGYMRHGQPHKNGAYRGMHVAPVQSAAHGTAIPFVERLTCTIADACEATGLGRTKL